MKRTGYINGNVSNEILNNLSMYVENITLLPSFSLLPAPVSSHADMLMYKLNDSLLIHRQYYEMNFNLFKTVDVTLTDEYISNIYPHDILLNCLKLNSTVYCKADYISKYIKSDAEKIVNVKQGYARCSTCIINEHAIITADRSIARNVIDTDVLLIKEGYIKLQGYDYGFIGGASINMDGKILFLGDIKRHPDCNNMIKFCEKHNVEVISLSNEMLYDYGSMVII